MQTRLRSPFLPEARELLSLLDHRAGRPTGLGVYGETAVLWSAATKDGGREWESRLVDHFGGRA